MELKDLPGIGPVNAGKLQKAGIETPEQLRALGSQEAFLKVRFLVDDGACLHMLYGLEAAVLGVPKKLLPPERKAELRAFLGGLDAKGA